MTEMYFSGIEHFEAACEELVFKTAGAARMALRKMAAIVAKQAKINATGRPGPMVQTGVLRSSIEISPVTPVGPMTWKIEVGPTAVYGRRIELGFYGTDSLGRHYMQDPYPFLEPSVLFAERIALPVVYATLLAAMS